MLLCACYTLATASYSIARFACLAICATPYAGITMGHTTTYGWTCSIYQLVPTQTLCAFVNIIGTYLTIASVTSVTAGSTKHTLAWLTCHTFTRILWILWALYASYHYGLVTGVAVATPCWTCPHHALITVVYIGHTFGTIWFPTFLATPPKERIAIIALCACAWASWTLYTLINITIVSTISLWLYKYATT